MEWALKVKLQTSMVNALFVQLGCLVILGQNQIAKYSNFVESKFPLFCYRGNSICKLVWDADNSTWGNLIIHIIVDEKLISHC